MVALLYGYSRVKKDFFVDESKGGPNPSRENKVRQARQKTIMLVLMFSHCVTPAGGLTLVLSSPSRTDAM